MTMIDPLPPSDQDRCWLKYPVTDRRDKVRIGSQSYPGGDTGETNARVEFVNLTRKERDALESFMLGGSYVRCVNGRIHAFHAWEPLPGPEEDPLLAPHWKPGEVKQFGGVPMGEGWHSPGITITALGAGIPVDSAVGATRQAENQQRVVDCGFECLRSRRGKDGRYWEQWVLHGLWAAKGPLKDHLEQWHKTHQPHWHLDVEEAARFLTVDLRIAFGSMDVTIQRWALTCDD